VSRGHYKPFGVALAAVLLCAANSAPTTVTHGGWSAWTDSPGVPNKIGPTCKMESRLGQVTITLEASGWKPGWLSINAVSTKWDFGTSTTEAPADIIARGYGTMHVTGNAWSDSHGRPLITLGLSGPRAAAFLSALEHSNGVTVFVYVPTVHPIDVPLPGVTKAIMHFLQCAGPQLFPAQRTN